jgi:hypothetical protein
MPDTLTARDRYHLKKYGSVDSPVRLAMKNGGTVAEHRDAIKSYLPKDRFEPIPISQEKQFNLKYFGDFNRTEQRQQTIQKPIVESIQSKKLAEQKITTGERLEKFAEQQRIDKERELKVAPYAAIGLVGAATGTLPAMIAGEIGGRTVDYGSRKLTSKSWGENVLPEAPMIGELTNPGYLAGGLSGIKSFKNNFVNNTERNITNSSPGIIGIDIPKRDYKDLFKNSGFEIDDSMKEMMRRHSLKESQNKDVNSVLDNFYNRVSTDEGIRRANALGINPNELSNRIKVKEDPFSYGYYSSGNIYMHPENTGNIARGTTRHELEHHIQSLSGDKPTIIDNDIKNLELRYNKTDVDWESRGKSGDQFKKNVNIDNLKTSFNNDKQLASDYFLTGSEGKESGAMLSEVQQYMIDNGFIKHAYEKITPEKVKQAFSTGYFDKENPVRIFKIMKASDKNYDLISKNLNKMLTIIPTIGIGYGLSKQ